MISTQLKTEDTTDNISVTTLEKILAFSSDISVSEDFKVWLVYISLNNEKR